MRAVRHQAADLAVVAGRRQPAGMDDQHLLGEALDLLEDVRREQDRAACRGHRPEQLDHVEALPRVHAVERLVEQQDLRVVDEGAGDLDPLAHALRVRPDRAPGRRLEIDGRDRAGRGRGGVRQAVERGAHLDELAPGQEVVDRLALRHEPDGPVHDRISPCGLPGDQHPPGRRPQEPGKHVQDRRLAGAVGAEQARDARPEREADVVDGDDVAVPARDVVELDRRRSPAAEAFAGAVEGAARIVTR